MADILPFNCNIINAASPREKTRKKKKNKLIQSIILS